MNISTNSATASNATLASIEAINNAAAQQALNMTYQKAQMSYNQGMTEAQLSIINQASQHSKALFQKI